MGIIKYYNDFFLAPRKSRQRNTDKKNYAAIESTEYKPNREKVTYIDKGKRIGINAN